MNVQQHKNKQILALRTALDMSEHEMISESFKV
jgi:hypothetical protein